MAIKSQFRVRFVFAWDVISTVIYIYIYVCVCVRVCYSCHCCTFKTFVGGWVFCVSLSCYVGVGDTCRLSDKAVYIKIHSGKISHTHGELMIIVKFIKITDSDRLTGKQPIPRKLCRL